MDEHKEFSTLERSGTSKAEGIDRAEKNRLQYDCGGCCRLCPFPGLKCIRDSHDLEAKTWKY